MFNLSELARGGTMCLSKAGLTSTPDTGVDIAGAGAETGVHFAINGILYYKADGADIAITAAVATGLLTTCIFLVCLDKDGTLSTVKGTDVLTADIASGKKVLTWPQPAEDTCPIGAFKMVVTTTYTFTAGTDELDATGCTATYCDLMCVPDQPVTSEYDPFA